MAGVFQQFLKGTADGFLGSPYLRDYQHASKTFLPYAYQNTPKFKWLFHTYFQINPFATSRLQKPDTKYGLMVKTIELPKFSIDTSLMNEYNRKRLVQTRINYDPVRVVFHDDNANQIRNLWFAYYSYYYGDPANPLGVTESSDAAIQLNERDIYSPTRTINTGNQLNWGYYGAAPSPGYGAGTKAPYFSSIKIYGFNQHSFAMYQLINPIISDFSHDQYAYATNTETMECTMTIKYESVKYYEGAINGQRPGEIVEQFGDPANYDTNLSPINTLGTNRSILGPTGLLDSAGGIIKDVSSGNYLAALQTAGRLSKTFRNRQDLYTAAKADLVKNVIEAAPKVVQTVRTPFQFPSQGATSGPGSLIAKAKNAISPNAPAVPVPSNNQITPV